MEYGLFASLLAVGLFLGMLVLLEVGLRIKRLTGFGCQVLDFGTSESEFIIAMA